MIFKYASIRYRTEPERIARLLPPPLELGKVPEVMVSHLTIDFLPRRNVFFPDQYFETDTWVRANFDGHEAFFLLAMPLKTDWGRMAGRELQCLAKKDSHVGIERQGDRVIAWQKRRGRELYRLDGRITDRPAPEVDWLRSARWAALLFSFRLNPDWTADNPFLGGVELMTYGGAARDPKEEPYEEVGVARALDLSRTTFTIGEPSVVDPICELPVLELLGGSYFENSGKDWDWGKHVPRREGPPMELLYTYEDTKAMAPWMIVGADRPCDAGKPWTPDGWPEKASAFILGPAEIERWRTRDAIHLQDVGLLDVTFSIDPELQSAVLPDGLESGPDAVARIIAGDVHTSDIAEVGFPEMWLMTQCRFEGRTAWYLLSNPVGDGGDVLRGREMFGYPTKKSDLTVHLDDRDILVRAERVGRRFAEISAPAAKLRDSNAVEEIEVIGLQADTFSKSYKRQDETEPQSPRGRLVLQKWTVESKRSAAIEPSALKLDLPDAPGPDAVGRPDPWFEFAGGAVISARVAAASVKRGPGKVLKEYDAVYPFYRERIDNNWNPFKVMAPTEATFRIRRDAAWDE